MISFFRSFWEKGKGYTAACFVEIMSFVRVASWYFTDLTKKNTTKQLANSGQPILCIHGLFHNSSGWMRYREWFENKGFGPVFTLALPSASGQIEKSAQYVAEKLQEIVDLTGRKDIVIIGHSLGGLIAAWTAMEEGQDAVHTVITLGSPLQGTKMAYLRPYGDSSQQMRPGSSFIQQLDERFAKNSRVRFHHFGTNVDAMVIPQNSAIRSGKGENYTLIPYVGHITYLVSPAVFEAVSAAIADLRDPIE